MPTQELQHVRHSDNPGELAVLEDGKAADVPSAEQVGRLDEPSWWKR